MGEYRYEYSGLQVTANFALPEWAGFEAEEDWTEPQVRIVLEDVELPSSEFERYQVKVEPQEVFLCAPEIAHYYVRHGEAIRIRRAPDAKMREVRLFLLGFAWATLCYQRGLLPIHASVVEVNGGVVAFCGASGAGKSTIAAWLNKQGYPLVSDDLCCCDLSREDSAHVWPSAGRLKLWRDALHVQGWSDDGLERDHFRTDKFHLTRPLRAGRASSALRAIYLLDWGECSITRVTGMEALSRFVAASVYRGRLLEEMGRVAGYWEQCAGLLRRTSVWEFRRPRNWESMDDVMTLLVDHWRAGPV